MIDETTGYLIKLDYYKNISSGTYLGIPLPTELEDIGIDSDINLHWKLVDDEPRFLKAVPTTEYHSRYHLSIQPRGPTGALATIMSEFVNKENSPLYGHEKDDPVGLEVNLDEGDVHLRIYNFQDYLSLYQDTRPNVKLPAFAAGTAAYMQLFEAFERVRENREIEIRCETRRGDEVIVEKATWRRKEAPEKTEQIKYDDYKFVFSAMAGEWYTVQLFSEQYGSREEEILVVENTDDRQRDIIFFEP